MEDIFKSIKAFLYDRAISPLFGAFVVAWLVWNYRVITVLLSGESIYIKFANIDKLFESIAVSPFDFNIVISGVLFHGIVMPAVVTFAYIYIYPFIAKPVYEHSLKKQQELRGIKQEGENNRLLSIEESRGLFNQIALLQSKYNEDTENLRNQISSLTITITNLENKQPKMASRKAIGDINELVNGEKLSEIEKNILIQLSGLPDGAGCDANELKQELDIHIDIIRAHIHELLEKKYLEGQGETEDGSYLYVLSPKGRRYLVARQMLK